MRNLIIKNESDADDINALWLVLQVVKAGRISKTSRGPQYCFVNLTDKYEIFSSRTKNGSDVFRLRNKPKKKC
jgi:hypothetical protein